MADSKITNLTEKTTVDGSEELVINDSTADKKLLTRTIAEGFSQNFGSATNKYTISPIASDSVSVLAIVPDKLWFIPLIVGEQTTFTRIGVNVTSALASSEMCLGIYKADGDGRFPSTLILDAGTVDTSTTGEKEITISQTLEPGIYHVAGVADQGISLTHDQASDQYGHWYGSSSGSGATDSYISQSYSYDGTLPTTASSISSASYPIILRIWLRVV